jgi:hypothetical protein
MPNRTCTGLLTSLGDSRIAANEIMRLNSCSSKTKLRGTDSKREDATNRPQELPVLRVLRDLPRLVQDLLAKDLGAAFAPPCKVSTLHAPSLPAALLADCEASNKSHRSAETRRNRLRQEVSEAPSLTWRGCKLCLPLPHPMMRTAWTSRSLGFPEPGPARSLPLVPVYPYGHPLFLNARRLILPGVSWSLPVVA